MHADRPPAVLELLGPSTGGIRVHVGELARRLTARGWRVVVAGPPHVMTGAGQQDAVVEVPTSWNPVSVRRARRQFSAHLSGPPIDVVHAHGLKAAFVALSVRRRRSSGRPPIVLTVHNLVVGTRHGIAARVLARVERGIITRADHVVVISDEIDQRLHGWVPDGRRTFVLPVSPERHPTRTRGEVRAEHGIDADAPLVVIVARHHLQKDLPMFLRAMVDVVAGRPDARAVMVGDGPERRAIEAERTRLGLDDVVVVAGHRPNPADEMQAADVVALTSSWEGSPLAVAECLALGRPLVTTAVGTVTRHLTDGVDARVIAVGDHAAFADAVVDLLEHPDQAATMGLAGQRTASAVFDPEHLVDGIESVYRALIGRSVAP